MVVCSVFDISVTDLLRYLRYTVLLQSHFFVVWQSQVFMANHQQTSSLKIFVTFTVNHSKYLTRGLFRLFLHRQNI